MIPREIIGPQERFERTGAQRLRDIRPLTSRLWAELMGQSSALVLGGAAGAMVFEPASVEFIVPSAFCYAALVLTRRVKLPMRLPRSARMPDWNYPDPGTRRPRMAAGTIYLGRDLAGKELWISSDDGRQHGTIPGTTGAGKTTAIVSFLANALTHASGFVLVDGKADNKLYGEILALARRFGREDDVLALNFMVASGAKDSNTFNPFASGNADAIREMLVSQLGDNAEGANSVFRGRAVALAGTLAPVLVWMRDHEGVALSIETIRFAIELGAIWNLAINGIFEAHDARTGKVTPITVSGMPENIIYPLKAYLGELSGYDMTLPYNKQKSDEPAKQHGYAAMYFTQTFTQLAVSLGNIFKVEQGDIDMRDVVLNRRILVVNLPALENSDDTLAGLGKIVVASLRGMMAQMLGSRLEGDHGEIVANKPGMGAAPFQVVLDELAYYATSGMDRMLAMGRGLNIMFWLGFQEVSGIWARLGEKTQSLLGNANLTVAMRQQDAKRTREWIEGTAGKTYITQATSYHGGDKGEYRETREADVREVARVDWNDLTRLIEGEAIVLFGGRRIYAKLFHAAIDTSGPMRLNRPLMLSPPVLANIKEEAGRIEAIRHAITSGSVGAGADEPCSPALSALLAGFRGGARRGVKTARCVAAMLGAARRVPFAEAENTKRIITPFTAMLDAAGNRMEDMARVSAAPLDSVDAGLFKGLAAVEAAIGTPPPLAGPKVLDLLARRSEAFESAIVPDPLPVTAAQLCKTIEELIGEIALGAVEKPAVAPRGNGLRAC